MSLRVERQLEEDDFRTSRNLISHNCICKTYQACPFDTGRLPFALDVSICCLKSQCRTWSIVRALAWHIGSEICNVVKEYSFRKRIPGVRASHSGELRVP